VQWYDKFGCSAVHYARAFGHRHVEEFLETVKSMPYLGRIPIGQLHATYLPEAVKEGCCAGVWRYVTEVQRLADGSAEGDEVTLIVPETLSEGNQQLAADVGQLLSKHYDPFGETLLHIAVMAAQHGKDPSGTVTRALLLYRADAMAATTKNDQPLHYAAGAGLNHIYALLVEAVTEALGGDEQAVRAIEEEASNFAGQTPGKMLVNTILSQSLKKDRALADDSDFLKRMGFFAFRHARMTAQLYQWRGGHAVHLFDVLHEKLPFLQNLDESSESDGHTTTPGNSPKSRSLMSPARRRLLKRASGSPQVLQGHDHLLRRTSVTRSGTTKSKDTWQDSGNHSTDLKTVLIASKIKSKFSRQSLATKLTFQETSPARLRDEPDDLQ